MPPKRNIYPIFMPHAGCPYQCVYCNQNAVTSTPGPSGDPVGEILAGTAAYADMVKATGRPGEIAFYGGTFTALPQPVLRSILECAQHFIEAGLFTGTRFSTRPDALDEDILAVLSDYSITTVEIGAQSLCDAVLIASGRGYRAEAVFTAAELVRKTGWNLGIQLMAGLPEDTAERFLDSVRSAIAVRSDFTRIYPTLVLKGTSLAGLLEKRKYTPLGLNEAIDWVVPAYDLLCSAGIPVIRMGLHADPGLEKPGVILAGPYHPAFGYLVKSRWWRNRIGSEIELISSPPGEITIRVAPEHISEVVGAGRDNIEYWKFALRLSGVRVAGDSGLTGTQFVIETR